MRVFVPLVAALLPAALIAQGVQDEKVSHRDARVMVVTGCVQKSWLIARQVDNASIVIDRYRLRGNKDLMRALTKDNDRRTVEVTGALIADPDETQGRGKTIRLGEKTTITTGARDLPQGDRRRDPTLEVTSFRVLRNTCS